MSWPVASIIIAAIIGVSGPFIVKSVSAIAVQPKGNLNRSTDAERLTKVETRLDNIDEDIKEVKITVGKILDKVMKWGPA